MKKLIIYGFALTALLGCRNAAETTLPLNGNEENWVTLDKNESVKFTVLSRKLVQCVFTLDYDDVIEVDFEEHSIFENRLGLLSGFDLDPLVAYPSDSNVSDSSAIYVASYADCDTTTDFINLLAEKHLKGRLSPPLTEVDAKIYIDLAKRIGLPIDIDAFQALP